MGANPRIVTAETWIQWDGVSQRLPRGQVLDVVPGSALERAIGLDRLVPLGGVAAQPAVEPAGPVEAVEAVGRGGGGGEYAGVPAGAPAAVTPVSLKSRTVGKKADDDDSAASDGKDGAE